MSAGSYACAALSSHGEIRPDPSRARLTFLAGARRIEAKDAGRPIAHTLESLETWHDPLINRLKSMRALGQADLVVGALPFLASDATRLFCPTDVQVQARGESSTKLHDQRSVPPRATVPPPAALDDPGFREAVQSATHAIENQALRKVVLARACDVALPPSFDINALVTELDRRNPTSFIYAIPLTDSRQGDSRHFVGASPELLLSKSENTVVSVPLAGSIARASDPEQDRDNKNALLESGKDLLEHRLVVEEIVATLKPWVTELHVDAQPNAIATPTVWHLATRIVGRLRDPGLTSLALAAKLHPTPAVCGVPRADAYACIRESETFHRGLYTGAVGYMNSRGDGQWAVSIRCAEVEPGHARIFAGAGIVAGSEPDKELRETQSKMETMINALNAAAERT